MNLKKIKSDLMLALSSQLFTKLLGFVVAAMLARHLDKSDMGEFFFAATYTWVFALLTELGTGKYLMRRIAEDEREVNSHLSDVLSLRVPLMAASFVLMNVAAWIFMTEQQALIVLLSGIYIYSGDLYFTFAAVLVGMQRLGYRCATSVVGPLVLVILVTIAIGLDWNLHQILGCYILAHLALLGVTVSLIWVKFGHFEIFRGLAAGWRVARDSFAFYLILFLGILMFKVDTLMLRAIRSAEDVATYEAGYRIFEVSRFVVRPASMVFFPLCTQMAVRGQWAQFRSIFTKLMAVCAGLGLMMAVGMLLLGGWLIPAVWGGRYQSSIEVVRVLFLAVPALYLGFVSTFMASALYLERAAVRILFVCLVANIGLNSFSISRWGAIGAAWTTLITEVVCAGLLIAVVLFRLHRLAHGTDADAVTRVRGDETHEGNDLEVERGIAENDTSV